MLKQIKENHLYFIIDIAEPYAESIFKVLKEEQIKLNDWPEGDISFKDWIYQTFGDVGLEYIDNHKKVY